VLSSRSRMEKIISDIILDFKKQPRLSSQRGNAILVASSIYEACRYFDLFRKTNSSLKDKVGLVTSYSPHSSDVSKEDTGASTETQKEFMYNLYEEVLGSKNTENYEDFVKAKFTDDPANMKLLIVVSKLLTGFDAPACTYLYIDKSMQDHGLFQAICRVNRLDSDDKQFGYIVDYKDLFTKVEKAVSVYTAELEYDEFELEDIDILLQDRLTAGKERLENALEELHILCEPVAQPKETLQYIQYFCGNTEIELELKATELRRNSLYKKVVALVRAYANISEDLEEAGYSDSDKIQLKKDLDFYIKLRAEIRQASGEVIDLKMYEADMRHLIDTYIQAEESKVISPFEGMPLIDIIINSGISEAINSMPKGIKSNREAIAETIENNVRRKIIKDSLIDPAYFAKMSSLLDELIKERKLKAISYEAYLEKIAEIAKRAKEGKNEETPSILKTRAQRTLYNNIGKDATLAIQIDTAVKTAKRDSWRGNESKENEIKQAIYNIVKDKIETERIFTLIEQQEEY